MVIQVDEHGGTLRGCPEKVSELPQNVRANRVHLMGGSQPPVGILAPEYIEVVVPKISHHFLKLTLTVYGADDFLRLQLRQKLPRPRIFFDYFGGAHLNRGQ